MARSFMPTVHSHLRALRGTVRDLAGSAGDPELHRLLLEALRTTPEATKALPWLWRSRPGHDHSLSSVVETHARRAPTALAIEMGEERLGWYELDARTSRLAHALDALGVKAGDVVALVGHNAPDYLVNVLGISRLGAVAALVNHHLTGAPLGHAIRVSGARLALVDQSLLASIGDAADLGLERIVGYRRGELEEWMAEAPDEPRERARTDTGDDFVYIYTSGTTGLPKPSRVTHGRALLAGIGFGTLMFRFGAGDELYSPLPLYHSSGLLVGVGSCIMTRTPLALRESFSARAFWSDVQRYGATAMLYIGELCRYLLETEPCEAERNNPIRVAVGNGMRADVWRRFQERFGIEEIREFYSATEAPGVILNLSGKVGSIGYVPARRFSSMKLARYDVEAGELERDDCGYCIECGPEEAGQLLIRLPDDPKTSIGDFRGYTDEEATKKKIVEDPFEPGDRYFLSGDLLQFDTAGFFYFVDRVGDTYRWKGENVSTEEVAEVLSRATGVRSVAVTGVHVPGHEGQAGLAAIVCDGDFDREGFWAAAQELPGYAQPRFLRVTTDLSTTGTFKLQKASLRREGVDPEAVDDPLYVRQEGGYLPLTPERYAALNAGRLRL